MVSWRLLVRAAVVAAALVGACSGESNESNGGTKSKAGSTSHAGKSGAAGRAFGGGNSGPGGQGSGGDDSVAGQSDGGVGPGAGRGGSAGVGAGRGGSPSGVSGTSGSAGRGNAAGSGTGGPPRSGWGCILGRYGDGVCDCGCGLLDVDCKKNDLAECERCDSPGGCSSACPGNVDPADISQCIKPPDGWTCLAFSYGDGPCDCGCGVSDIDCKDSSIDSCDSCSGQGSCSRACPGAIDPQNNATCKVPDGWSCPIEQYGDGYCECGCGALDRDCSSADVGACQICATGCWNAECPGSIDARNNAVCTGPPWNWNCLPRLYDDGSFCDCGCGAHDPDCASHDPSSCDSCDGSGSCSAHACPGTIDSRENSSCAQPSPPSGWTCDPTRYADGFSCDCGCGVVDLDCATDALDLCDDCSACSGGCPYLVDPTDTTSCQPLPAKWECSTLLYGDGNCHCGCGAPAPDCATATKASCTDCPTASGSCSRADCSDILASDNSRCN